MCLLCYIPQIQNMGNGHQQGGVLLGMSCYLGFEVYPFCNFSTETAETPSPVSSPRGKPCLIKAFYVLTTKHFP